MLSLLGLSAVGAAAFFWWESRAAHPLLDLRYLRVPRFLTANVVAFCAYFATFAVFFFTALYLEEVVGDTGYQIALAFLPMTVLMIAASLLAGRWTSPSGPRWSIFLGCLTFGAGLLLTTFTLSPHPAYVPLAGALALTGLGIGATVVPITSAALSAVPPARSGMAASATNTSREIGAVTGVAILGALVNAQLRSSLTGRLKHLGIPANFQSIVIHAVETGGVPSNGNTSGAGGAAGAGQGALVQEVIHAAYSAFYAGLHAALLLSAFLVLAAGLFTFVLLGRRRAAPTRPDQAGRARPGAQGRLAGGDRGDCGPLGARRRAGSRHLAVLAVHGQLRGLHAPVPGGPRCPARAALGPRRPVPPGPVYALQPGPHRPGDLGCVPGHRLGAAGLGGRDPADPRDRAGHLHGDVVDPLSPAGRGSRPRHERSRGAGARPRRARFAGRGPVPAAVP